METTTGSSFWFVLSACVGGVIVLVGLLMETLAEKKWFGTVNSFRRCESSKRCGEWAVIFGIVIEVVVAGWSAKDEWKNKPENQPIRSEEHTSELQSLRHLVCRLLLEKK